MDGDCKTLFIVILNPSSFRACPECIEGVNSVKNLVVAGKPQVIPHPDTLRLTQGDRSVKQASEKHCIIHRRNPPFHPLRSHLQDADTGWRDENGVALSRIK